ncbi:MAG: hypothetical protein GY801_49830 [bacterium]|nr:hypothetical protein [bacterium]
MLKLGKLNEDEVTRWRKLLYAVKSPDAFFTTLDDVVVTRHYAYLDVAVANAMWDRWELDTVFHHEGKRAIRLALAARILTLNRCIEPAAKSKTPKWFRETSLPWLLELEDVTTITWLLKRLRQRFQDLQATRSPYDRGMVSEDNLTALEQAQITYISAMDTGQIAGIAGLDFSIFSHLEPERIERQAKQLPGFIPLTDTTYYREMGCSMDAGIFSVSAPRCLHTNA